ncbi:MAG: iron-containing alcohol dehydrogenase, partial [Candidatus Omnitrophota bacterium]
MLNFTFHNPTIIYFGRGRIKALEEEIRKRAKKVLVVTGRGSVKKCGIFDEVIAEIKKAGVDYVELSGVQPNPRLKSVYEGIELCRKEGVDFILPVGGGSVIDAAKAIAVGAKYKGDVWDFFETDAMPEDALPLAAVLTVAATGSEMNPNAVISEEEAKRKLALSSPLIQPVFSILDPAYTFTVNRYHTAAGVADIMAHVFEYYLSPVPHTETQDALSEALLKICIRFGGVVCENGDDYDARANILWASTLALSGLIGKGKISDWTCHAIEHEVSAIYDISHGAGLAVLLPAFIKVVSEKYGPDKLREYGINVWGVERKKDDKWIVDEAITRTRSFLKSLGLPSKLSEMNISDDHFEIMTENVLQARAEV